MKNFKYIFILFLILSCKDVNKIIESTVEEVTVLENDFLIKEAWIEIEEKTVESLDRAFEIFNDIIFNNELNADPYSKLQAYHGLGWAQMFYSNTLSGSENAADRLHYRELAYDSFFSAYEIYETGSDVLDDLNEYQADLDADELAYNFDYRCDILAGKILYSDYKVYHYLNEYYSSDSSDEFAYYLDYVNNYASGEEFVDANGNGIYDCTICDFSDIDNYDGEVFTDANGNGRFETGITKLANYLRYSDDGCPDYNMPHASIDIKNINVIVIKNWIRRGMYDLAADFINAQPHSHTINFTLEFDSETNPELDVRLLGDFSNKTIDSNDLFAPSSIDGENYLFEIDILPYLPCQVENYSTDTLDDIESLRAELLDCIDIYFETNSEVTFRYKYVNGDYDSSIDNQEFYNSNDDCVDSEGFRTITIPVDDSGTINVPTECFDSCLPCN